MSAARVCGGCARDGEVARLSSVIGEGSALECSRCGFPTYLVLAAPLLLCTHETHAVLRTDVALFKSSTKNHQAWAGLLTAECVECDSTIALDLCKLCREPCASGDALPWGTEDERAHFGCVARAVLARPKASKFVIVVGQGAAREFVRS